MIEEIFEETRESMEKSVAALKRDLKRLRTGRASLSILDAFEPDGNAGRAGKPSDYDSTLGYVRDQGYRKGHTEIRSGTDPLK